uniref:Uncharacterized protein n=1 Tax=Anguilla anguilla TaxID=7936 RepID=A0A0E9QNR1_ANGAN
MTCPTATKTTWPTSQKTPKPT